MYTVTDQWYKLLTTSKVGTFTMTLILGDRSVIAWGDGEFTKQVSSLNQYDHTYAAAGDKDILLRGQPGSLGYLTVSGQDVKGVLDLSRFGAVSGNLYLHVNPNITQIKFPVSETAVGRLYTYDTGVEELDFRPLKQFCDLLVSYSCPKLKRVYFPETTAYCSGIYLYGCDLEGELDLSPLKNLSGTIRVYNNPRLTGVKLAPSSNAFNYVNFGFSGITGVIDLSMLSKLGGELRIQNAPNVTGVQLPITTQQVTNLLFENSNFTGTLDLRNLQGGMSNLIYVYNNPNLTEVLLPPSDKPVTKFQGNATKITHLDLSMLSSFSGELRMYGTTTLQTFKAPAVNTSTAGFSVTQFGQCSNLAGDGTGLLDLRTLNSMHGTIDCDGLAKVTKILFPPTDKRLQVVRLSYGGFVGEMDMSGFSWIEGDIRIENNSSLNSIKFAASGTPRVCSHTLFGFNKLNQVFPFGTLLLSEYIRIAGNLMSQANLDATIANVGNNRALFRNNVNKLFYSEGGTNASPGGIFRAPAGYVQGGQDFTPGYAPTAKEWMYLLTNQTNPDGTLKYKWTFTTN